MFGIEEEMNSLQAKYSRLRLFNLGEMSCFNQHNAVQWIWIPLHLRRLYWCSDENWRLISFGNLIRTLYCSLCGMLRPVVL